MDMEEDEINSTRAIQNLVLCLLIDRADNNCIDLHSCIETILLCIMHYHIRLILPSHIDN
jgi:hypothetical protein